MLRYAVIVSLCLLLTCSIDNGLGLTPQMGWNSWNHFGCKINEDLIQKTADLLVSTGLAKKGYVYVNLDDCWQVSRNATTRQIIEDKTHFPNGMKSLGSYIHSKGLKYGLYSDAGEKTCEGRPGGLGHEKIDATTYAAWEVDYLKYDNCYNTGTSGKIRYLAMSKALNESGRHIFYSMCNWGEEKSWEWAAPLANSWRTTGDIQDRWVSFIELLEAQNGLQQYAGKGGWNDPDMLEVGNGGMTFDEYYAHFSLWCLLKAPLLIGCSLENITEQTLTILGNQELIAVNQDSLGKQGKKIFEKQTSPQEIQEAWGGDLSNNRYILILLNRGKQETDISISIKGSIGKSVTSYSVRDVIEHKDLGVMKEDTIKATVRSHAVKAFVLTWIPEKNLVQEE